jgi:hypothetical protein
MKRSSLKAKKCMSYEEKSLVGLTPRQNFSRIFSLFEYLYLMDQSQTESVGRYKKFFLLLFQMVNAITHV